MVEEGLHLRLQLSRWRGDGMPREFLISVRLQLELDICLLLAKELRFVIEATDHHLPGSMLSSQVVGGEDLVDCVVWTNLGGC